jgi:hypothetical protein
MLRGARLLLLLVAALLLPPRAAFARSQYFCHMQERVVSTCCCGSKRSAQRECELRASSHDCCERIAPVDGGPAHAGFRHDASVAPALLAVLLAAPSEPVARPFVESDVVHPGRGPPPAPRTPLFIAHCALLI